MSKSGGGGLGFVLAIVVLVIVLLLTAKAWNAVMPTAAQALSYGRDAGVVPGAGASRGAGAPAAASPAPAGQDAGVTDGRGFRTLPNLRDMQRSTEQHKNAVGDAAKGQD